MAVIPTCKDVLFQDLLRIIYVGAALKQPFSLHDMPADPLQHSDTGVGASPKTAAVRLDSRVPLEEVGQCDLLIIQDLLALRIGADEVEGLAVCDHSLLDRRRGSDAVAGLRR